jgi:hypothetical protein
MFEDFIEQLLHHCGEWPEPKSVLVMDNAFFHHTERISKLCSNAGVKSDGIGKNIQVKISKISLNGAWISWELGEKV